MEKKLPKCRKQKGIKRKGGKIKKKKFKKMRKPRTISYIFLRNTHIFHPDQLPIPTDKNRKNGIGRGKQLNNDDSRFELAKEY